MKGYSTFSKAPGLKYPHQMQFSIIPRTLIGVGVSSLSRDAISIFYNLRQMSLDIDGRIKKQNKVERQIYLCKRGYYK